MNNITLRRRCGQRAMQFSEGDIVSIQGKRTQLITKLTSIEGGWVVDPRVENLGYWNEQEMKPVRRSRSQPKS